jgi:hypothetical protein
MSGSTSTIRSTAISPRISGSTDSATSIEASVAISGRLPQEALAKATRSTWSVGRSEGRSRIGPASTRSRPVACFAASWMRGL